MPPIAMSEPATEALRSLAEYPTRTTASGIAHSPYLGRWLGAVGAYRGLTELADLGLAVNHAGRWCLTARGRRQAR